MFSGKKKKMVHLIRRESVVSVVLCVKIEEMASSMWKLGDGKRKEKKYEKDKKIKKIYIHIYYIYTLGNGFWK